MRECSPSSQLSGMSNIVSDSRRLVVAVNAARVLLAMLAPAVVSGVTQKASEFDQVALTVAFTMSVGSLHAVVGALA